MKTNHIETIKDKLSILDVVSPYVNLKKAGKDWKGTSPFTHEKTPSFFVSPDKGFFYCFSSGKGGDIFDFIQEIERVDFKEALTILADQAGVDIKTYSGPSIHTDLYRLLNDATKWYEVHLRKNPEAISYLTDRGLSKESIIEFRIGFAKNTWRDLFDYLKRKGYTDQHIEQAGLAVPKKGGGYYDRFRSRIMFPIMDSRSRVVGFSGRIWGDGDDGKQAKYVNSPDGPLFDKSKLLYGYHLAKTAISKEEVAILVEGQFDVVLSQQAGNRNTVAVSGTGLTDNHITLIKRFANTVKLCFDSDKAGIKATRRSVLKAYEHGLKVEVMVLPSGEDPADVIKRSVSKWEVYVKDAKDYIDYRLDIIQDQEPKLDFEDRQKLVTDELFDVIYLMKSKVRQDRELQKIAGFLGVSAESVRSDFEQYKPQTEIAALKYVDEKTSNTTTSSYMNASSDYRIEIISMINYLQEHFLVEWDEQKEKINTIFQETYDTHFKEAQADIDSSHLAMFAFKYDNLLKDWNAQKIIDEITIMLQGQLTKKLKEQAKNILSELRQAEHRGDEHGLKKLQREHQETLVKIDRINQ